MRIQRGADERGVGEAPVRRWLEPGPEVAPRMLLDSDPGEPTAGCYVLTRGAERAWDAINHQMTLPRGAFFWIGGGSGTGKTHFLNYAIALSKRAPPPATGAPGRHLTVAADASERAAANEIDRQVLDQIGLKLAGDRRAALWRQLRGAEGVRMALDQARRQGVKGILVAIDLGAYEQRQAHSQLAELSTVAHEFKHLRLVVVVAGRETECEGARSFMVAPNEDEELSVICGRARLLNDEGGPRIDALYRNLEAGSGEPRQIYPLHPAAADGLMELARGPKRINTAAAMLREAIVLWDAAKRPDRLLMPAELMRSGSVRHAVEVRLGSVGRAALAIAHKAAATMPEEIRGMAGAMIDTLVLHSLSGTVRLKVGAIVPRLRDGTAFADGDADSLMAELAGLTDGIIAYEAGAARFNPSSGGTPAIAAFNAAIGLVRRFDQSLTAAAERPELNAKLRRLADAMASALERSCRNRDWLEAAMHEAGASLNMEQQRTFDAYIEMAERGVRALIETGVEPDRCAEANKVVTAYEALAAVAAAAPGLRVMREYLDATGLMASGGNEAGGGSAIAIIETEYQLLRAAVAPAVLTSRATSLDALEERFHKFKWNYIGLYRAAHVERCRELTRLAGIADDLRGYLAAIGRLNRIAALGVPEGVELASRMEVIAPQLLQCDARAPLVLEVHPRCAACGFVLGALAPAAELNELAEHSRRALEAKLAALSQSAIARLIEQHDRGGRLEGFLKITQAAQTDALVRVLDDRLAAYLAKLLDENHAVAANASRRVRPLKMS